jgi:hypothetical protein
MMVVLPFLTDDISAEPGAPHQFVKGVGSALHYLDHHFKIGLPHVLLRKTVQRAFLVDGVTTVRFILNIPMRECSRAGRQKA